MRIVFMGTPEFAVPALEALVAARHDVVAAYSQPPRPGGRRGRELVASPVQRRAEALEIAVRHPVSLRSAETQAEFAGWGADIAVVAAYGLLLPRAILDAPKLGCLNIHASLLPRWRGAAPIQRAILAGDSVTGVTIMRMEAGLDTGPMLATAETLVGEKGAGDLIAELAAVGAGEIVRVLNDLAAFPEIPQPAGATYAAKLEKAEARLDFSRDAAAAVRQVQAFNPPGAYFEHAGERIRILAAKLEKAEARLDFSRDAAAAVRQVQAFNPPGAYFEHAGERIRILAAVPSEGGGDAGMVLDDVLTIACGGGAIRPLSIQRAGRGVMTPAELLRGFPIPAGTRLA